MTSKEMQFKKFPKVRGLGLVEFKRWQKDTAKKRQKQIEDANKELMNIFSKAKPPFDRETHGRICKLQGYIKAKKEDLEALKDE